MHPGPSLVAVGVLVLIGTAITAAVAHQVGAHNRLSRFLLWCAAGIGAVALAGGVLDLVTA